jgi:histidine decarboxylase
MAGFRAVGGWHVADVSADIDAELDALFARLSAGRDRKVGYPGGEDISYDVLSRFASFELNNAGDPYHNSLFDHHTKEQEREVIAFFADLLRAPADDRWGYVTSGSTECLHYGLRRARQLYPDAIAYYSTAAHYKVGRVLDDLRMDACLVPADSSGEISYTALRAALAEHPGRAVIIAATAGTTMTEAVDDVRHITKILDELGVVDRYIHVDAALSGIPLALMPPDERPGFDFADGADSIGFSAHKFLATRSPGGVVIQRHTPAPGTRTRVSYIGAADTTFGCSRDGYMVLKIWYAMKTLGVDGLRARAEEGRHTASYLARRLKDLGWPAWRHPHAMTVALKTPPHPIATGWMLPHEGGAATDDWSHYICLPGRGTDQVDRFVEDFARHLLTAGEPDAAADRDAIIPPHGSIVRPGYPASAVDPDGAHSMAATVIT